MRNSTYTLDDLLRLVKLGRFGSDDMNYLAGQAFLYAKRLEKENLHLKKALEESNVTFFSVDKSAEVK
jgi:hypothetical protein